MNQADMETLRNALTPALHCTDELVLHMRELLGSWDRVEWWFLDAVHSHRLKAGDGDASGYDADSGLADSDDLDLVESLTTVQGVAHGQDD
jgi:hypothetical protein